MFLGHPGQLCTQHTITSHFLGLCPCSLKLRLSYSKSIHTGCHCPRATSRTASQSGNVRRTCRMANPSRLATAPNATITPPSLNAAEDLSPLRLAIFKGMRCNRAQKPQIHPGIIGENLTNSKCCGPHPSRIHLRSLNSRKRVRFPIACIRQWRDRAASPAYAASCLLQAHERSIRIGKQRRFGAKQQKRCRAFPKS